MLLCFLKRGKTGSPQFSLLQLDRTGSLRDFYTVLILMQHTARLGGRVWPVPGKEPRQNVDRTILVTVLDESTIRTTIGPFPQRHGLPVATATTGFGRVAFI